MYLEEVIDDIQLENDKFECKSKLNRDDVVGWLKTIAGFVNAQGGEFYIGVEDKTNKLIGFDRSAADNERNYFNNQVNEHLVPRPRMEPSFIRYEIKGKERFLIRVRVLESAVKPIILKYKNIPSIFMRRDGFTNGATYEEIIEMSVKSKNTQYDILTSDVKYDVSKFKSFVSFTLHTIMEKSYQKKHCNQWDFMMRKVFLRMEQRCLLMIIKIKRQRCNVLYFLDLTRGANEL